MYYSVNAYLPYICRVSCISYAILPTIPIIVIFLISRYCRIRLLAVG